MNDCLFCRIVQKDIPAHIVYEDQYSVAFLDINPTSAGHTLVVTKEHYARFAEIPRDKLENFFSSMQKVAKAMESFAEGFHILQNNGPAAGQIVNHVHFHFIPRNKGDGVQIGHWRTINVNNIEAVQREIQNLLKH